MSSFVEFPVELYNPNVFNRLTKSSDLTLDNALALMWFAQLSYETGQPDTIEQVAKLWMFDSFHVGRMLYCTPGANFTLQTPLTPLGSNKPVLMTGFIAGIADFFRRVFHGFLLSPRGPGPLGGLFRWLPAPIREHLQDRYLIALGDTNLAAELRKK